MDALNGCVNPLTLQIFCVSKAYYYVPEPIGLWEYDMQRQTLNSSILTESGIKTEYDHPAEVWSVMFMADHIVWDSTKTHESDFLIGPARYFIFCTSFVLVLLFFIFISTENQRSCLGIKMYQIWICKLHTQKCSSMKIIPTYVWRMKSLEFSLPWMMSIWQWDTRLHCYKSL